MIKMTDRVTDLSSTDDSTLEMNQSEREGLWDLLAFFEAFCEYVYKPRKNVMTREASYHLTTMQI